MLESFSFPSLYSVLSGSLMTYHFLATNFEDSLSVSFKKSFESPFYVHPTIKQQIENFVKT